MDTGMGGRQLKRRQSRREAVKGGVNALVARLAYAGVEGAAFIWTKEGAIACY